MSRTRVARCPEICSWVIWLKEELSSGAPAEQQLAKVGLMTYGLATSVGGHTDLSRPEVAGPGTEAGQLYLFVCRGKHSR